MVSWILVLEPIGYVATEGHTDVFVGLFEEKTKV